MDKIKILNELAACYYEIAGVELTMNLFSFYDGWTGQQKDENDRPRTEIVRILGSDAYLTEICDILKCLYSDDEVDIQCLLSKASDIREGIKSKTLVLALLSDRFKLYEYLLNRLKPVDKKSLIDINNDAAARDILSAIFSKNDNALINENIKFAVSQLPIRMTKSRFFDIIDFTCQKYIDGDRSSLDRESYMILSSAGICEDLKNDEDGRLDFLFNNMDRLSVLIHDEMTEEEYIEAESVLGKSVDYLVDSTDVFRSLAEIVNFAIVMLLNRNRVSQNVISLVTSYSDIISFSIDGILNNSHSDMPDDIEKSLERTEGRLEFGFEKLLSLQAKATEYISSSDNDDHAEYVANCSKLLSESVFAELGEEKEVKLVDRGYAESVSKNIRSKFEEQFESDSRLMKRARMAAALGELPVFFNSRTDVMNYVRDSIDGCRNLYEKLVSVKLITDNLKV